MPMEFYGKALYNLLRMNPHNQSEQLKAWQTYDYRTMPADRIFSRLQEIGISLDKESFLAKSEIVNSPEELAEKLLQDIGNSEIQEEAFLLLFEAWRRFCPQKQTLSIFCDELDHIIDLYDKNPDAAEEALGMALDDLENILDKNADEGEDPVQILHSINSYCAHDVEGFLYDFISDQIANDNDLHASELIDGFYPYVSDKRWFDLLRLRILSSTDAEEASAMLSRFMEVLDESFDLDLAFEMLRFLIHWEDQELFAEKFAYVAEQLEVEEDFQELLDIASEYFEYLGREKKYQKIQAILQKRSAIPQDKKISFEDPDLSQLLELISSL